MIFLCSISSWWGQTIVNCWSRSQLVMPCSGLWFNIPPGFATHFREANICMHCVYTDDAPVSRLAISCNKLVVAEIGSDPVQ
jgi:hypothetical protein